jgi:hypothetical protein
MGRKKTKPIDQFSPEYLRNNIVVDCRWTTKTYVEAARPKTPDSLESSASANSSATLTSEIDYVGTVTSTASSSPWPKSDDTLSPTVRSSLSGVEPSPCIESKSPASDSSDDVQIIASFLSCPSLPVDVDSWRQSTSGRAVPQNASDTSGENVCYFRVVSLRGDTEVDKILDVSVDTSQQLVYITFYQARNGHG